MFSRFFIDRPIFATVLSIVITLAGGVAAFQLPIAQYPQITPPSITVSTTYPGANAETVSESLAAPIEQQVNGVENMMYMSSNSANDGSYSLTVTFKPGVNMNFAQVLVQNRVNLALPQLPDVVKQIGVTTRKRNPDILLVVNLYSPDDRFDQLYLSNYANIHIADEVKRIDGVGDVFLFGQQDYSMRLWVDPDQLASRGLTAIDVANAVREQNMQVAAGQIGQPTPTPTLPHPRGEGREGGAPYQFPLTTLGRLSTPEQFGNIILRTLPDGRTIRVKDVGRVELGAKSKDVENKVDFQPTTGVAVFQLPDANALDTAQRIRDKMDQLKKAFPPGLDYKIVYDTTPFISESIVEVFKTLGAAILLVAAVVLVFLQSWRSTIIPLVAVPVAIIGTFAVMAAIGFSLNNLTLFGLVLAIGIVVDDAIVVVEAVEHHIEEGMQPKQAAIKAMEEVSGPVIAVALVLSAVFVPCAFISGITGQFFRQFALTIAVSTLISALNSLTLSPALASLFLKPRGARRDLIGRTMMFLLGWFFWLFNWTFRRATNAYVRVVGWLLYGSVAVLVVYVALLGLTYWSFNQLPAGYIPTQDKGYLLVSIQLPDAASLERTKVVVDRIDHICHDDPGVGHTISIAGMSFSLGAFGSNFGQLFVPLKDFDERGRIEAEERREFEKRSGAKPYTAEDERRETSMYSTAIADRLTRRIAKEIPDARVSIVGPPPVSGLGSGGGFKFMVEERGVTDLPLLQEQTDNLVAKANRVAEIAPDGQVLLSASPPPPPADGEKITYGDVTRADAGKIAVKGKEFTVPDDEKVKVTIDGASKRAADLKDVKADSIAVVTEKDGKVAAIAVTQGATYAPSKLKGVFTIFTIKSPQKYVNINRQQCERLGVNPSDVFQTLQIYLGSRYVNDFNLLGRTWQVNVQAEGRYRTQVSDVKRLMVRNQSGGMVPLGTVADVTDINGPLVLTRYNMYPAAAVIGDTRQGVSSGEAMRLMEKLADQQLPKSMAYEWTEINYIQQQSGNTAMALFALGVLGVFLVLAALYESWALPLAVILVVPMCLLSSVAGVATTHWDWLAQKFGVAALHSDINIFTQIGFVVLVGLASKNAILIVEFAKLRRDAGRSRYDATLDAVKLRLRPILMTSFAFILGTVPLMIGTGAGAEMRQTLGIAVFSGMLGVTLFGIFLTPVFFYVIEWVSELWPFNTPEARHAGAVALDVLRFGPVRRLTAPWWRRAAAIAREGAPARVNGAAKAARPAGGDGVQAAKEVEKDGERPADV